MITRNGSLIYSSILAYVSVNQMDIVDNYILDTDGNRMKTTANDISSIYSNKMLATKYYNFTSATNSESSGIMLLVGSGTTEPTINDYNLESIITTLSYSNPTRNYDANGNMKYACSYLNNTADNITISEFGVFLKSTAFTTYSSDSTKNGIALIGRSLLDEPVILVPSQECTLEFCIKFN